MTEKNPKVLIETFLKFEAENKLFDQEILNVKYWHLTRFNVYNRILDEHFNLGQAHTNLSGHSLYFRLHLKLKQFRYFIFNNPMLHFKQQDILILNHQRRIKNDQYFTCVYTDLLLDKLEHSNIVIEEPHLEKHMRPIKHKNILYTDYINLMVSVKMRLSKLKLTLKERTSIELLYKNLEEVFGINIDFNDFYKLIVRGALSFKYRSNYYRKFLDRLKPKVIIQVVSYGGSRYVMNALAKELGIPTIELQHGTMGIYHIAYNFKEKFKLDTFPDYVFTFGQYWKDNTRLPIKDERVKVVGWPFFEEKVNYYKKNQVNKKDKTTILFISQGTIGKELSKFAVELSELFDTEKYEILYKLHPGEYNHWKAEYPWLINKDILVVDQNTHDMHYYFSQADIQVGVYSTALYEGLAYHLRTFILPLYGHHYLEDLIELDLVKVVDDAKDFYVSLSTEKIDLSHFTEQLWKPNSLSNLIQSINAEINH